MLKKIASHGMIEYHLEVIKAADYIIDGRP